MQEKIDKRERAALFRKRLLAAMAATECSRAELARKTGIDRSTVSQILTHGSARMPGAHVVAAAAQELGVSSDWLLGLSDRPEQVGELLSTTLSISETGRAAGVDDRIFAWHEEAAGYKIRHVPATLPDMLKTNEVMKWEYASSFNQSPGSAIAVAEARLDWMRSTQSDYEIALPLQEMQAFAEGSGYYRGLPPDIRRAQIDWIRSVFDQLFPTLRLFFFDAQHVYSAPITVFGPKRATIYLGRQYVAFRDRDRVQEITRHFDWLIRESEVSERAVPAYLDRLHRSVEV